MLNTWLSLCAMLVLSHLCCAQPARAVEPDPEALGLIQELGLRESPAPVRESERWRSPEKVVVYLPQSRPVPRADYRAWLQAAAGGAELVLAGSRDELQAAKRDADVLLGYCQDVTDDMWELRWVQNYAVGIDRCTDNEVLLEGNVLLTNTRAVPGPGIAEHVMAMMFMLTRKMDIYLRQQSRSEWRRIDNAESRVMEVGGKTLLVVGLGGIGRQVARRAHGLGMQVLATRRSSRKGPGYVAYVGLADELLELATKADVVVNATPLTRETTGLFNRRFFRAMKPSAYFINVGRGRSVVTHDLMAALENGELAGAGLDVTDPEPLPADHPLWKFPNVVITPHSSSPSDQMARRFWTLVRENLRRYVAGERMLNVVDVKRGY